VGNLREIENSVQEEHLMAAVCIDTRPVISKENHEKFHGNRERLIERLVH
jgi:hypothetical protein